MIVKLSNLEIFLKNHMKKHYALSGEKMERDAFRKERRDIEARFSTILDTKDAALHQTEARAASYKEASDQLLTNSPYADIVFSRKFFSS